MLATNIEAQDKSIDYSNGISMSNTAKDWERIRAKSKDYSNGISAFNKANATDYSNGVSALNNRRTINDRLKDEKIDYSNGLSLLYGSTPARESRETVNPRPRNYESIDPGSLLGYVQRLNISKGAMPLEYAVEILHQEHERLRPPALIDERYLAVIVSAESGFNPRAKNPHSTATGWGGFIDTSWPQYSDEPFSMAKEPHESTRAIIRLTEDNLQSLEKDPDWYNRTRFEQQLNMALCHIAGYARMRKAGFNPHRIENPCIREQTVAYEHTIRDLLTR